VVRSHNVYTSLAFLAAWYHFTRRESFMALYYCQQHWKILRFPSKVPESFTQF